ncbi:hypothetical protein MTZ49_08070 [Entomomonas sp. E2T0]|uniref:hypothetical protein n=1 Tax=Entomomonas sp. E2T0 TaxID=2930213 RepID=UPI00222814FF|nr:hypothetical protein [Entomomonas sp. E2T0]UYZ82576.1 hypothetical protein MTZ49_08070 [Entomomonas sp. E2T0]
MAKFVNRASYIIILLCLNYIIGCSSSITFLPDDLPTATVGKPYYIEVQIKGGAPVASLTWEALPVNNGFFVETIEKEGFGEKNFLKVYGTPIEPVNTKITLYGFTYGTSSSGEEFKKTYLIKVKKAN